MKAQNSRNANMKASQMKYIGDTFVFTNTRSFKKFEIMSFFREGGGLRYVVSKTFWNSQLVRSKGLIEIAIFYFYSM